MPRIAERSEGGPPFTAMQEFGISLPLDPVSTRVRLSVGRVSKRRPSTGRADPFPATSPPRGPAPATPRMRADWRAAARTPLLVPEHPLRRRRLAGEEQRASGASQVDRPTTGAGRRWSVSWHYRRVRPVHCATRHDHESCRSGGDDAASRSGCGNARAQLAYPARIFLRIGKSHSLMERASHPNLGFRPSVRRLGVNARHPVREKPISPHMEPLCAKRCCS